MYTLINGAVLFSLMLQTVRCLSAETAQSNTNRPVQLPLQDGLFAKVLYNSQGELCKVDIPRKIRNERELENIIDKFAPANTRGVKLNELDDGLGQDEVQIETYQNMVVYRQVPISHKDNAHWFGGALIVFKAKGCEEKR